MTAVQGLVVPMVVQEGRWQVLMYTGTEKLPGMDSGERSDQGRQLHLNHHLRSQSQASDELQVSLLRPGPCLHLWTKIVPLPQTRARPPS